MTTRRLGWLLSTALTASWLGIGVARADSSMASSMTNFWNSMGGYSNATGPSAYQGQSAGYYTGGNLYMRTPVKNLQMAALQLPGFRAGCGGIDFFSGAFSFVNADQFIALLKGVANNATGFAFKLALKTISPMIDEELGELNDLMQKINQSSINSCQTAEQLVGDIWPQSDSASQEICQDLGNQTGIFADYASARQGCGSNGQRASTLSTASGAMAQQLPVNRNYAWDAITNGSFFSGSSVQFQEEMMTLAGTIIVVSGSDDNSPGQWSYIAPKALDNDIIQALLHGGQINFHVCDETQKCLHPAQFAGTESLDSSNALSTQVQNLMTDIINHIQTDTPITSQETTFLNVTTLPVYKLLTVWTAYNPSMALSNVSQYSDLIALDIVYHFIDELMREVEISAQNITSGEKNDLETWRKAVSDQRRRISEVQAQQQHKMVDTIRMIESTQMIEKLLAAQMSQSLAGNLSWSRGMSRR